MITQATGDGTTIRYESFNYLTAGDTVNITGLGALNLSSATVASATRNFFTVTNAPTGSLINVNNGIVALTNELTAADGAYVAGVAYIDVPNVLGETTALALDELKDAGYEAANITTATAASNVGKTITAAARTAGSAVISLTCASHGFVAGNKVTVSDVSGGDGVNGTWTVLAVTSANVFTVTGTATTVQALTSLAGVVSGVAGTTKTQSTAANANTISTAATITVTPFAAAS